MADYKLPHGDWPTYDVSSEGRRVLKDIAGDSNIKRELHLETHLSNTWHELADLLVSKHRDYGPKNISLAPGGAINGLRVRMHDKLARINNLVDSGVSPEHESLEDSFKDMANYAVIGLLVLRKQWDNDSNFNQR
jgi:hypothetical protein